MPCWDHKKGQPQTRLAFLRSHSAQRLLRFISSPCTPEGEKGRNPLPLLAQLSPRSAFGLRIPFGSEIGPLVNETGFEFGLVQKRAVM